MTDTTLFLLATAAGKAGPERPPLPAGKLAGAQWAIRPIEGGTASLAPGETLLAFDGATVGAPSMATPTASVSLFSVLARALKHAGCTRDAIAAIVVKATAAELAGETDPDAEQIEEQIKALRAAFAANLPKVPRVGALTMRGARFEAAAHPAEGAPALEGVAQSA